MKSVWQRKDSRFWKQNGRERLVATENRSVWQRKANCSHRSLKKSDVSDLLVERIASNLVKKYVFFVRFYSFFYLFPLLCPRANCSRHSLLICSFLKTDLTFAPIALCKKSDHERFAQVATLSQKPRAISFPRKRCNYQNHNRKEIVPFFLYLATKETFPSCPNATLPQKKYFFIIKSPT